MTRKEFEQLTGVYVTHSMYEIVEKHYMECEEDKQTFCNAYKNNVDGLAEKIQFEADTKALQESYVQYTRAQELKNEIERLEQELKQAKKEIDRLNGWQLYIDKHNVSQMTYKGIAKSSITKKMSDEEAKKLISKCFGFDEEKIIIRHSIPKYEINSNSEIRKNGEIERLPLYGSSDWNYIRFDCGLQSYEMIHGILRIFN